MIYRVKRIFGALLLACVCACEPGYAAHPVAELRAGASRRVGCVEFGVEAEREATLPLSSLLVQVNLKNHCSEPALVDLNALVMWAERKNGDRFEIAFYDPRREVTPLHIEIEGEGIERLQVDGAGAPGALRQVCFDPSFIAGPSQHRQGAICYLFDREPSVSNAPSESEEAE